MIRDLLGDTLGALGYSVETVEDFEQAVATFNKNKIDLVLTDVMLPGKSGVDLTRHVKENHPHVPVLAISGKGVPEQAILEAGADGFLAKPFRIGVVEDLIWRTLIKYDIGKVRPLSVPKKILVVDDEPIVLSTMLESLKALGYQAVEARNGQEALEKISQESFDLVITDIKMPGKNGIDLMRELKSKVPGLQVVIITGYPLAYPPEKARAEGADGYIAKPFRLNHIDRLLGKLLYNYDGPQE